MSEVQTTKLRFPKHQDFSERSWMPRCCIKITTIHRDFLRVFIQALIRARVNNCTETVQIRIDDESFTYLMEILQHVDNFRFIKSSVENLTEYGGSDNPLAAQRGLGNSQRKKTLSY